MDAAQIQKDWLALCDALGIAHDATMTVAAEAARGMVQSPTPAPPQPSTPEHERELAIFVEAIQAALDREIPPVKLRKMLDDYLTDLDSLAHP